MSTGMAVDEVLDQLTLPMIEGFGRYWRSHPPLHIMVAAYLGIKPEPAATEGPREMNPEDLAALMSMFPQTAA